MMLKFIAMLAAHNIILHLTLSRIYRIIDTYSEIKEFLRERNKLNSIHLTRDTLTDIALWHSKHQDARYITIIADSSSGIGTIIQAACTAVVSGDEVLITKTFVDESSW